MQKPTNLPILISLNDAARLTSLSRTMINRLRREGSFPVAVPLGDRRVAFVRDEVLSWVQDRIAARSNGRRFKVPANDNLGMPTKSVA